MVDTVDSTSILPVVCDPVVTKKAAEFYNQTDGARINTANNFYYCQHTQQRYDFVISEMKKYEGMDKLVLDPWIALKLGGSFTDDSDPDTELNQIYHSFYVTEALRKLFRDEEKYEWLHLTGLTHGFEKIVTPAFGVP